MGAFTVNAGGTGDVHADRHAWKHNTNRIAVTDTETGQIVAWYERKKEYRSVSMFADFLVGYRLEDRRPIWQRRYDIPADSDARTLRIWFLHEIEDRYGVSTKGIAR